MKITLKRIKNEVKKIDPTIEDDSEYFMTSVILLSSLSIGPNIDKLKKFTGYPKKEIQKISKEARRNKIWVGSKVDGNEWINGEHGGLSFILDTMVVRGLLERSKTNDSAK